MKFLKLLSLMLLFALTAACIGPTTTEKISFPNLDLKGLVEDIENVITDGVNNCLPAEAGSADEIDMWENTSAAAGAVSPSSKVPDVPTYSEEKSNVTYSRENRLMSQNFQRAIGSGDEKRIAAEVFNITGKASGYDIEDACDVFDYVNEHWKYRYDKNAEFFFGASQTINEGYNGDCDDYSIVMSALLKNMGFNTRVVTATNKSYGHAYPELYIGNDEKTAREVMSYVQGRYSYAEDIWYSNRKLEAGGLQYWLNFDWSGSNGYRHPGGIYFEGVQVIYYPNGLIEF
jgi:hypothetical protein